MSYLTQIRLTGIAVHLVQVNTFQINTLLTVAAVVAVWAVASLLLGLILGAACRLGQERDYPGEILDAPPSHGAPSEGGGPDPSDLALFHLSGFTDFVGRKSHGRVA